MIKYIFGPVPSRRLGVSLGVDIVPFKTCTLDCIYCECGRTNRLTVERGNFVEPQIVLEELKQVLSLHRHLDYITFSGSGEPTLHQEIGVIINRIKELTPVPVAVLTNGTLLFRDEVRKDLLSADLVLPSLDAITPGVFARINQPHAALDIQLIGDGLVEFSRQYRGQIWLEVFIVSGINDGDDELDKLYAAIQRIAPQRVQLNSLDRPPAYENVEPVDFQVLERIVKKWADLPVEIIKRAKRRGEIAAFSRNLENSILNTLRRRPLTIEDLEAMTGKKRVEIFKYIDILEKEKKIAVKINQDKIFYVSNAAS